MSDNGSQFSTEFLVSSFKESPVKSTLVGVLGAIAIMKVVGKLQTPARKTTDEQKAKRARRKELGKLSNKWFYKLVNVVFDEPKVVMQFGLLVALLIAKAILSLKFAELLGDGIRLIVESDFDGCVRHLYRFALFSMPASVVNAAIRALKDHMSAYSRRKLNNYVHDMYLRDTCFYDIAYYIDRSKRITDTHQRLVVDLKQFTTEAFDIFVNGFKPFMDVIIYSITIRHAMGYRGLSLIWTYFAFMFAFKEFIAPSFSSLIAKSSTLEGRYISAHQRVINYAEEIAFFKGARREKHILNRSLDVIFSHSVKIAMKTFYIGVFDNFVTKYAASMIAYLAMSLPLLMGRSSKSDLAKGYSSNAQYLLNLATGVKQLALIRTRIAKASGRLGRIAALMEVLMWLQKNRKKAFESMKEYGEQESELNTDFFAEWKEICTKESEEDEEQEVATIKFENLSVVSPDKRLLLTDLNLEVKQGEHLLITGANGTGKSSLFRTLGGLWPASTGKITKSPEDVSIYFLTQNPYFVTGNLREQFIYPLSLDEALQKYEFTRGLSSKTTKVAALDKNLSKLLDIVDPHSQIERDFNTVKDWLKELSGGQRQLVSIMRLAFHRPVFALLDECTSAVDNQKDSLVFVMCKALGITMLSISHKHKKHRKYHDKELRLTGGGAWHLKSIDIQKETDEK